MEVGIVACYNMFIFQFTCYIYYMLTAITDITDYLVFDWNFNIGQSQGIQIVGAILRK